MKITQAQVEILFHYEPPSQVNPDGKHYPPFLTFYQNRSDDALLLVVMREPGPFFPPPMAPAGIMGWVGVERAAIAQLHAALGAWLGKQAVQAPIIKTEDIPVDTQIVRGPYADPTPQTERVAAAPIQTEGRTP